MSEIIKPSLMPKPITRHWLKPMHVALLMTT